MNAATTLYLSRTLPAGLTDAINEPEFRTIRTDLDRIDAAQVKFRAREEVRLERHREILATWQVEVRTAVLAGNAAPEQPVWTGEPGGDVFDSERDRVLSNVDATWHANAAEIIARHLAVVDPRVEALALEEADAQARLRVIAEEARTFRNRQDRLRDAMGAQVREHPAASPARARR